MMNWKHKALDLAPARLLNKSTGFRRQLLDLEASPYVATARFRRTLEQHWHTLSDDEKRNVFMFAEWCVRQFDSRFRDGARDEFYAPLFDHRERDWADGVPWLSPFIIAQCWPLWETRLTSDELIRLQGLIAVRTETRYALVIVATQIINHTVPRRPPLSDMNVQLTVQIEYGDSPGSVGQVWYWEGVLPENWEWEVSEYLSQGVHAGLATVEQPLPNKGLDFIIALTSVQPPITAETSAEDVRQFGEVLFGLVMGAVISLWRGTLAMGFTPMNDTYRDLSEHLWRSALRKGQDARGN